MLKLGFPNDVKPILVAVSGGVDSMVLASLLLESGYSIALAHCNYQLRGADSDEDEALVRKWCAEHNIPFHLKKVETKRLVEDSNSSIQMVARDERYRFFQELMTEYGYATTALAHHANDRVESLLMNVLRGTGFRGLQGMPSKRDNYIRPLLGFTKDEIREYAQLDDIPFREDASNAETYYQRNWIRLKVLPMLRASKPDAFEKLLQLCKRTESELPNYEKWIKERHEEIQIANGISIEKLQQSKAAFTLLKELLEPKGFSSDQVFEVLEILNSISGTEVSSETHRVLKDRDGLLVSQLNQGESQPTLRFEILDRNQVQSLKTEANVALLDADKINRSELKIRKWQQGDKFKPLGMKGWKLLSDFFIDQKLSVQEKERTWLLTYQNEIVWVIGMRLDNRFKVTDSTQKVLNISVVF
ncbi:MAG: tRNA lysidine(34) synthetase TilS [Bacteroidota bacterium]